MAPIYDTFSTFARNVRFRPAPERKVRRIRVELAAKSRRDEMFVEGNTFHEYSIVTNNRILDYTVSDKLARGKNYRLQEEERDLSLPSGELARLE